MKPKIKYVITSFDCGGAEIAALRIISKLNYDYDIEVITFTKGSGLLMPEFRLKKIKFKVFGINSILDSMKLCRLLFYLRKQKPDIIITSLFHPTIVIRIFKPFLKGRIISWMHSENFGNIWRRLLYKVTVSKYNLIIADSKKVFSILKNKYNLKNNKLRLIEIGGLDLNLFDRKSIKKKKMLIIGSIGSLRKVKGYKILIKAVNILNKRYVDKIEFEIAGMGIEYNKLKQMIRKIQIKNLRLLGYKRNIPELLSKWDIYVQPSLWEGLCMTVVEACASGLPIVASNVGGIPETVKDNLNGYLVPPNKPKILAEKLSILIDNKNLRIKMGKESRKIAEQKYSIDIMISKFKKVLDNQLSKKRNE